MWNILEILFSSQNPNFYLQYICNLPTHVSSKSLKGKYYLSKFQKGKSKNVFFIFKFSFFFLKHLLIKNKKKLMSEKKFSIPKNTIFRLEISYELQVELPTLHHDLMSTCAVVYATYLYFQS